MRRALCISAIVSCLFICVRCAPSFENGSVSSEIEANSSENQTDSSGEISTIMALDVGQGDATLILTPSGKSILIDGGPLEAGTNIILPLLTELGLDHLDYLFVSHYDADHIGGIAEILAGEDEELNTDDDISVSIVYDRGESKIEDLDIFEDYLASIGENRSSLEAGTTLSLGDGTEIHCLVINGELTDGTVIPVDPSDENANSMGLLVSFGSFSYFTAGDLPGGGESGDEVTRDLESLVAPLVGPVDLLHVNHHGSETSTNEYFLDVLKPQAAVISVGEDNPYGHPHPSVLGRLTERGIEIYETKNGSVIIQVQDDGSFVINGDEYENEEK